MNSLSFTEVFLRLLHLCICETDMEVHSCYLVSLCWVSALTVWFLCDWCASKIGGFSARPLFRSEMSVYQS